MNQEIKSLTRREAWAIIASATITDEVELFVHHGLFRYEFRGLCKVINRMKNDELIDYGVYMQMQDDLEKLPGFNSNNFYWPWSVEGMESRIDFARKMAELEE